MLPVRGLEIVYKPIGYVRHNYDETFVRKSWRGVEARIEILPDFADGLRGLEGFSHIIVIAHLDRVDTKNYNLIIKPRGFLKVGIKDEELPEVGIFSTASPLRPNPIAVTIMRLLGIKDNILYVDNCDLYSGTPVLDIKPLTPSRCPDDIEVPGWLSALREKALERTGRDIFKYG